MPSSGTVPTLTLSRSSKKGWRSASATERRRSGAYSMSRLTRATPSVSSTTPPRDLGVVLTRLTASTPAAEMAEIAAAP
eukprot:scaffold92382_cov53-Phaeocystis_antarctica.AAC.2